MMRYLMIPESLHDSRDSDIWNDSRNIVEKPTMVSIPHWGKCGNWLESILPSKQYYPGFQIRMETIQTC